MLFLTDQPVTIIRSENRNEVWVELPNGELRRVFKAGLSPHPPATTSRPLGLRLDNSRGTDGAR